MRKLFEIGGIIAGVVLIAFGVAAIYMGFDGRSTVRDSIEQEQIVFGSADDPAVAKHAVPVGGGRRQHGRSGARVRPDHPRARDSRALAA